MRQKNARTGIVRLENTPGGPSPCRELPADVRRHLCDTKYFGLRPQPLERYLYRLNLPRSAERVFWLHWDAGNRNGNFCSELAISQVARECCLDESSVTRAYQTLKGRGLIRRQDPGRDPSKPFCQATAITEVLLPKEALAELLGSPNRQTKVAADSQRPERTPTSAEAIPHIPVATLPRDPPPPPPRKGDMKRALRALAKLTPEERTRYEGFRQSATDLMHWEEGSALTVDERELLSHAVLRARYDRAHTVARTEQPHIPTSKQVRPPRPRLLNAFCLAYLRKKLTETAPLSDAAERLREITWSVEQGALAKLEVRLAMNVALKKVREGQWTRPNRMPPNWQLAARA